MTLASVKEEADGRCFASAEVEEANVRSITKIEEEGRSIATIEENEENSSFVIDDL